LEHLAPYITQPIADKVMDVEGLTCDLDQLIRRLKPLPYQLSRCRRGAFDRDLKHVAAGFYGEDVNPVPTARLETLKRGDHHTRS
jgi:hypothetical protein